MTLTITVWHNVAQDKHERPLGMIDGYQPGHPLTPVARFETERAGEDVLAEVCRLYNVGDDPDFGTPDDRALAYRRRGNRSLSVGDIVQVNQQWWVCDRVGWKYINPPAAEGRTGGTVYGSTRIADNHLDQLGTDVDNAGEVGEVGEVGQPRTGDRSHQPRRDSGEQP